MVVKKGILIVYNIYRISYEYILDAHLISFSNDVFLFWSPSLTSQRVLNYA